jgi:hypothetical protein
MTIEIMIVDKKSDLNIYKERNESATSSCCEPSPSKADEAPVISSCCAPTTSTSCSSTTTPKEESEKEKLAKRVQAINFNEWVSTYILFPVVKLRLTLNLQVPTVFMLSNRAMADLRGSAFSSKHMYFFNINSSMLYYAIALIKIVLLIPDRLTFVFLMHIHPQVSATPQVILMQKHMTEDDDAYQK